jgi:hypothetical protein
MAMLLMESSPRPAVFLDVRDGIHEILVTAKILG